MANKPQPGQAIGKRDSKTLKRNRHIDMELPDRAKEAKNEDRVAAEIAAKGNMHPGRGGYPEEIKQTIIELRRDGLNASKICQIEGMPERHTIYVWRDTDPDFKELWYNSYNDGVREKAEDTLILADDMLKVKGLVKQHRVNAIDKVVGRRLQIARARLKEWGRQDEEETEVIVIEVGSEGWDSDPATATVDDPHGQGPEAAAAQERWKKIRDGAEDV